jgi:fructose/tagatose bisphosphate aldolase
MEIDFKGSIIVKEDEIEIKDENAFKNIINELVSKYITTENEEEKGEISWIIWKVAGKLGVFPASINELYRARGRREFSGFTIPAMNLRTLTFDLACRVFKVAKELNAGAFIFEIAKSEMGYTNQPPVEYSTMCLAAAIKEDYCGPLFIQGDHFQLKLSEYKKDKEEHLKELKDLIIKAINSGFYNIDIDSSTLVDLSKETIKEQQFDNFWVCAELTKFIREIQPKGITISVGGEIGEVGGKNSTPQELREFMKGYLENIGDLEGISKISIQTGTTHGGVILPDGNIAKVKIDFQTLKELSEIARKEYGLAGAVQHGASTLPKEAFHKFPEVETAEIHLATQFQNIVYENLPQDFKNEIYSWIKENLINEKKEGQTEDQFIYKTRKKALGPFKTKLYNLPNEIKENICNQLEELFKFLFLQLKVDDTKPIVEKYIKPIDIKKEKEEFLKQKSVKIDLEGAD